MNLLMKIFPLSNIFSKQGTGKLILGAAIYVVAAPILAVILYPLALIILPYAGIGCVLLFFRHFSVVEDDTEFSDLAKTFCHLSYTNTSKENFAKGLVLSIFYIALAPICAVINLILWIINYCKANPNNADKVEE